MCTVTYIPQGDSDFILTSNRDEAPGRTTIAPSFYDIDGVKMLYPKDAIAGGSWIGLSEKSRLICLLNGGFEIHVRAKSYTMSRGVVVKELLKADNLTSAIQEFEYTGIEPFTIVAVDWQQGRKAIELVWDGAQAHINELGNTPHIWSSSTLYTGEMKVKRKAWFASFQENNLLTPESLLDFHTTAGEGDKLVDVRMDRGFVKTVSITQVIKADETCGMSYHDLQKKKVYNTQFEMIPV